MVSEEREKTELPSPGALLRAGREKAGLSIEQVAEKLHLLQSVVNQLEKDCYDRIRGDTFVRGYMRNYARLLGIDANEVIGRYKNRPENVRPDARFSRRREGWHGSSGAGGMGVVAVLLALSAVFLLWNRSPVAEAADSETGAITVETARGAHVLQLDHAGEEPRGQ
jgi:cytoskeleton protein RodZ